MEIVFKQNTPSGCGLYCLANLFNNESFLEGVNELKFGLDIGQLNKYLNCKEDGLYYIETLFLTNTQLDNFPARLTCPSIFGVNEDTITEMQREELAVPYLLNVKGAVRFHLILAVLNFKDKKIYVFDSLKNKRQTFTASELIDSFHIVGVSFFRMWEHPEDEVLMNIRKPFFSHLFKLGE